MPRVWSLPEIDEGRLKRSHKVSKVSKVQSMAHLNSFFRCLTMGHGTIRFPCVSYRVVACLVLTYCRIDVSLMLSPLSWNQARANLMQTCRDSAESWKTECQMTKPDCKMIPAAMTTFIAECSEILKVGVSWEYMKSWLAFQGGMGWSICSVHIVSDQNIVFAFWPKSFQIIFLQTQKLYCGKLWKFGWFVKAARSPVKRHLADAARSLGRRRNRAGCTQGLYLIWQEGFVFFALGTVL